MNLSVETDKTFQLSVGGELRAAEQFIDVVNPATGETIACAPIATQVNLNDAVERASEAARALARDEESRRRALALAAQVVKTNMERLASTLSLEIGLPYKLAEMEVIGAAAFLDYRANETTTQDIIADNDNQRIYVRRTAIGVTGAILPWNAPLLVASEKLATALAAGNPVIMKPSALAPLTVLTLGSLLADILPKGWLSVLPGHDELGKALVAHPDVGMISFTGSITAGQAIMAAAASGLKRLSLELGGNDAAIVLSDADIENIARKLFMGAFFRTGQICVAIKRLYVHEAIHDALVARLKVIAESNVLGDPFDPATTMGPISNRAQFERVKDLVERSMAMGGTVVTGGAPLVRRGYFYPPTLLTDLPNDAPIVAEEQFGPVLPIIKFTDIEEAIKAANCTRYGLGGSVWTSDVETGVQIASQIESGSVWVNQHGIVLPHIPCGGMKLSGIGRANGSVGFDNYSELQTISISLPKQNKSQ